MSDSTHCRVVPYLNVAAPAALVEGAADERAAKGRRRRIVPSCSCKLLVQLDERHAGLHPHAIHAHVADGVEPPRAHQRVAHRRRPAGQRRLRANRQNAGGASQNGRNFRLRRRREESRRMTAVKVRGILEVAGNDVAVANGDRVRTVRRAARGFVA